MIVKRKRLINENGRKELLFSSILDNLSLVEKMIDEICEKHQISEDYYGNILVSLTEAVNNAIQHGNKYNPDKEVSLTFESTKEFLYFSVEDEGEGFDYNGLPDPTDPENIEKPYGRGIFLMKNLADNVEFSKNGRRVEIDFRIVASVN